METSTVPVQSPKTVVFHFPATTHDFQMSMSFLPIVREALSRHNLNFVVHLSMTNTHNTLRMAKSVNASAVVTLDYFAPDIQTELEAHNIKVIPLMSPVNDSDWGFAEIGYFLGVKQAQMCFEAGYQKIAYVTMEGCSPQNAIEARYAGIRDEAKRHGQNRVNRINLPEDPYLHIDYFLTQLRRNRGVDAFCCQRNMGAASILSMSRQIGKDIPREVGIIGYGDDPICELMRPQMSLVNLRMDIVLEALAESIIQIIDGKDAMVPLPDNAIEKIFRGTTPPMPS